MLNVDETSVGYTMKLRLGNVVAPAVAKVSKQDRRGAWTYLSLICNSTDVQGKLPHYLIGSKTRLTRKLLRAQKALPPTRLKIIAQKSAWTSAANLVQLLRDIGEVLKLYPGKQGILLLDCAPSHLPKEVMQAAKRQKVQLVYIPAQCTDVLQPLDICAFAGFKAFLRARHEGLKATSQHGLVNPLAWIWELMQCPREFFAQKAWRSSFAAVGCTNPPDPQVLHRELRELMDFPVSFPEGVKPTRRSPCISPAVQWGGLSSAGGHCDQFDVAGGRPSLCGYVDGDDQTYIRIVYRYNIYYLPGC